MIIEQFVPHTLSQTHVFNSSSKVLWLVYILFCFLLPFHTGTQKVNSTWSTQFHEKYSCQEPKGTSHNLSHLRSRSLGGTQKATVGSPLPLLHFSPELQNWRFSDRKLRRSQVCSWDTKADNKGWPYPIKGLWEKRKCVELGEGGSQIRAEAKTQAPNRTTPNHSPGGRGPAQRGLRKSHKVWKLVLRVFAFLKVFPCDTHMITQPYLILE